MKNDLQAIELPDETWSDVAIHRDQWHSKTTEGVQKWEKARNKKEQEDYEKKKARVGFKCPRSGCDFVAKNETGLKVHMTHMHAYESSESEEEAATAPPSTLGLSEYTCPYCSPPKDCSSGAGLSKHLSTKHPDKPQYEKKKKKERVKEESQEKSEEKTKSPTETEAKGTFRCTSCDFAAKTKAGLSSHVRAHHASSR